MFNWTHVTEANITFTTKIRIATLVEGTKQPLDKDESITMGERELQKRQWVH